MTRLDEPRKVDHVCVVLELTAAMADVRFGADCQALNAPTTTRPASAIDLLGTRRLTTTSGLREAMPYTRTPRSPVPCRAQLERPRALEMLRDPRTIPVQSTCSVDIKEVGAMAFDVLLTSLTRPQHVHYHRNRHCYESRAAFPDRCSTEWQQRSLLARLCQFAPVTPGGLFRVHYEIPCFVSLSLSRDSSNLDLLLTLQRHGDSSNKIAHDVGTGPGNIAARLTKYFDLVVGSDINGGALEAAPAVVSGDALKRMAFVHSPAEAVAHSTPAQYGGQGTTDLVTVSECMPLLDAPGALKAFHTLLRPGGTLAIYFYGPALFTDTKLDVCNAIYDQIATRICTFNQPMKGSPGFPFHLRAGEALLSEMDSLAIPAEEWASIERTKWNCDHPLLFNSKAGFDFDWTPVDRRGPNERTFEISDRTFWEHRWGINEIRSYLDSVYPNWRDKAGTKAAELEPLFEQLARALNDEKTKVTFPVVLILATKKESEMPLASRVNLSSRNVGLARLNESTDDAIAKANELLQLNHDGSHIFWRDLNGHNHMAHSILTHFALGASPAELQRANDDGVTVQRHMPELDQEIARGLSDEKNMRSIFGHLPQYTNALAFFHSQIDDFGWQAIMHKYLFSRTPLADTILARMYEGAHHPLIHLGLAVEFELPSILAEALAQAVVHPYSGIPDCLLQTDVESGVLSPEPQHRLLLDLYREARANKSIANASRWEDGPFKMRDGTLGRSKSEITRLAAQYRVKPSEMTLCAAEVIQCSALIAGACQRADKSPKIDFFHMHNVNSSIFLTALVQNDYISLENKVRMIEWKARTDLLWYAAMGCPAFDIQEIYDYQAGPTQRMCWDEIYRIVNVTHDDGHVAKFVRAIKSAEEVCKPFEHQYPETFPLKGEGWIQLARMAYDSTLDLPPDAKWVFGAGFETAWAAVPARAQTAPASRPMVFPSLTKTYHKTVYGAINPESLSMAGKNIVITGGGSGIGAAMVLAFVQAGAASVSMLGRRIEKLEETRANAALLAPEVPVYVYGTDVSQEQGVKAAFAQISQQCGKIDVLISNHGYKPKVKPAHSAIKEIDVEEWWKCFETNIKGTFNVVQAFLQCKAEHATAMYVTSALSHFDGSPKSSGYAASKAGGVRLFSTLQAEHPEIRVVSMHPGVVNTGVVRDAKVAGNSDDGRIAPCALRIITLLTSYHSLIARRICSVACESCGKLSER